MNLIEREITYLKISRAIFVVLLTLIVVFLTIDINPFGEFHDYIMQLYYVFGLLVILIYRKLIIPALTIVSLSHLVNHYLFYDNILFLPLLESITLISAFFIAKTLIEKTVSVYNEKNILIENLHIGYVTGSILYDEKGRASNFKFNTSNQAFLDMMKITIKDIEGQPLKDYMVQDNRNLLEDFNFVVSKKTKIRFTYYSKSQNRWFDLVVYPKDDNEFILLAHDISELQSKLIDIECISFQDTLTKLNNRRSFYQTLDELMDSSQLFFVIFFDMNGLKLINDTFGHLLGDEALVKFAAVLNKYSNVKTIPFRLGGDEFTIICKTSLEKEVEKLCSNIRHTMEETFISDEFSLSASYGYALHNYTVSINESLQNAEKLMYQDKISYGSIYKDHAIERIIESLFKKNRYEFEHSKQVSHYASKIGKKLGLTNYEINHLKHSSYYHDIGKITIDENLLYNSDPLDENNLEILRSHPLRGYQILRMSNKYSLYATDALYHHEQYDGKGYPNGLSGEDIPLSSRIIAVANAYSAMTLDHPYHLRLSKDEAIKKILSYSSKKYDPKVVKALMDVLNIQD